MILTVTLNPALDKILILNDFSLHKLHRLDAKEMSMVSPGGKGVNIAYTLKLLGNEVIASGFAGGHAGQMLCDGIRENGITTHFIFTEGATRTNTSILDLKHETLTEVNDLGQEIPYEDIEFFIENFERLLNRIELVVIAGSLPKGVCVDVYNRLIIKAKEYGKKVVIHTKPTYTEAFLDSSPYVICPDMRSQHTLFGKEIDGIDQFIDTGKYILEKSPDTEWVLFIHRIENVVAVTKSKSYIIRPKKLKIINMLGYGDAYLAGFIHGLIQNLPPVNALRFASASGLTNVENIFKEIRKIDKIEENISRIDVEEIV